MSSCNEHLAIRLMPLLTRRVPWKHILHVMISLIGGTYNPYSFCLVEGWPGHKLILFPWEYSFSKTLHAQLDARLDDGTGCVSFLTLDSRPDDTSLWARAHTRSARSRRMSGGMLLPLSTVSQKSPFKEEGGACEDVEPE